LKCSHRPLAVFRGPTSKGRTAEKGKDGEGRERRGARGRAGTEGGGRVAELNPPPWGIDAPAEAHDYFFVLGIRTDSQNPLSTVRAAYGRGMSVSGSQRTEGELKC